MPIPPPPSQDPPTAELQLSDELRSGIQRILDKYRIPGLSISVVRKQDGAWSGGVTTMGIRDGAGSPWTPDSLHGIASASKVFAAASIGILIDRGTTLPDGETLSWSTKIKAVLPGWKLVDRNTEANADIEDALSMLLGIPSNNVLFASDDETAASIVHRMRYHRPAAPLRKAVVYSNDNYIIIDQIVATLSGQTYTAFVKENILDPLGMSETTFNREAALASRRRVEGFLHHGWDGKACKTALDEGRWDQECIGTTGQTTFWDQGSWGFTAAAAGLWSTGHDILAWLKETLDPKILSKATLDELNRPRAASGPVDPFHPALSMMYYGLGQFTQHYRGHRLVGHPGGMPGYHTRVLRLPEDDIGVAVFCNDSIFGRQMVDVASMMVTDELLGLEKVDWEDVYLLKEIRAQRFEQDRAVSPRPSQDVSGVYHHPGYGTLDLVPLERHPLGPKVLDLLHHYPGNTIPRQPGAPVYVGNLTLDPAGVLLLTPFDGPVFMRAWVRVVDVQLKEGTKDVALVYRVGKCLCSEEGIGMFEDFWGLGGPFNGLKISECVEEEVEERSEVWFKRV